MTFILLTVVSVYPKSSVLKVPDRDGGPRPALLRNTNCLEPAPFYQSIESNLCATTAQFNIYCKFR
jgi:hypothetical protein